MPSYPMLNAYQQTRRKPVAGPPGRKVDLQSLLKHPPQELIDAIDSGGIPEVSPQPPEPSFDLSKPPGTSSQYRRVGFPAQNANAIGLQEQYNGSNHQGDNMMPARPLYASSPQLNRPLTPGAQRMTSRMSLNPDGMGGHFANFANFLAERQEAPQLNRPYSLQSNQQSTRAGSTPNITVGGAYALNRPAVGAVPVGGSGMPTVQRFAQQPQQPQFFNADGRQTLNDNSTLEARARQAALNLANRPGSGLRMLQGEDARNAQIAAGLSPQRSPEGWEGADYAVQGTRSPGRMSDDDGNPIPIADLSRPASVPRTSPEQVTANKERWQNILSQRQANVQARGIARGMAREFGNNAAAMGLSPQQAYGGMLQQGAQMHQMDLAAANQRFQAEQARLDRANRVEIARETSGSREANSAPRMLEQLYGVLSTIPDLAKMDPRGAKQLQDETLAKIRGLIGGQQGTSPVSIPNAGPQLNQPPLPASAAQNVLGEAQFNQFKGLGQSYGSLGRSDVRSTSIPGINFALPSMNALSQVAMNPLQLAAGGAGTGLDRRAAVLASRLQDMYDKGMIPAEQMESVSAALRAGMNPDFLNYVTGDYGKKPHGKAQSKFLGQLLQGQQPSLSEEEKRAIRERQGYTWLGK